MRLAHLALLVALGTAGVAQGQLPAAPSWVTDEPGLLSPGARHELDERLERYERATGHQVVVRIGRSTGGVPIEDHAAREFRRQGIGRGGRDDGLAIFVMTDDRVARIEVGYGLEHVVTDALASRVVREELAPRLAAGDGDGAIRAAVDRVLGALGGEGGEGTLVAPERVPMTMGQKVLAGIFLLVVLALFIRHPALMLNLLVNIAGRPRRGGGGLGRWDGAGSGWSGGLGGGIGGGWSGGSSGGGFHGGGGRSGGGGATGRW